MDKAERKRLKKEGKRLACGRPLTLFMKFRSILPILAGSVFVLLAGLEIGVFQRLFDPRSVVIDGVLGSEYWIETIDDEPTSRIKHGFITTRVPVALVPPGRRKLQLSLDNNPSGPNDLIEFKVNIEKGVDYLIATGADGNPVLVPQK